MSDRFREPGERRTENVDTGHARGRLRHEATRASFSTKATSVVSLGGKKSSGSWANPIEEKR
jgi:hypothetical protein